MSSMARTSLLRRIQPITLPSGRATLPIATKVGAPPPDTEHIRGLLRHPANPGNFSELRKLLGILDWSMVDPPFITALLDFLTSNLTQHPAEFRDLVAICLRQIDRRDTENWVTRTLLPAVLRSPDDHCLAPMIYEVFPELRQRAVSLIEKRLLLVATGQVPATLVAPYLRALTAFYGENPAAIPGFKWFNQSVIPLFTCSSLPDFHADLQRLCAIAVGYADEAAEAVVRFLVRHWPIADPSKIPLCIASLVDNARLLGPDARLTLLRSIVMRIVESIASEHSAAVQAGLSALTTPEFSQMLADGGPRLAATVREAVRGKLVDWNATTRQKAEEVIKLSEQAREPAPARWKSCDRVRTWDIVIAWAGTR
jgi:hypothetical protein